MLNLRDRIGRPSHHYHRRPQFLLSGGDRPWAVGTVPPWSGVFSDAAKCEVLGSDNHHTRPFLAAWCRGEMDSHPRRSSSIMMFHLGGGKIVSVGKCRLIS